MKTYNLENLVKERGPIQAVLIHQGYYNSDRCYFDPGECHVEIEQNNLSGGYVGNTLLVPLKNDHYSRSKVLVEMDGLLFLNSTLIVYIDKKPYTIKKRHNYLKIKGKRVFLVMI